MHNFVYLTSTPTAEGEGFEWKVVPVLPPVLFLQLGCSGLGNREAVNLLSVDWIWVFQDQQFADKDFYGHTLGFLNKTMLTPPHFLPLDWIILVMHAIEGNISQSQVNEFLLEEVERVCPMAVIKSCMVNRLWGNWRVVYCITTWLSTDNAWERSGWKIMVAFLVPKKPTRQVIDLIFMGSPALPCSHIQRPSNLYWVLEGAGSSIVPGFVEEKQGKI